MELESLFTATKWKLLEEISREPQSPLQLAEKLNTSIANVSQQLRLLEAAGIVKKERLPQRARGKPRVIFSLIDDLGYLIAATDGFADKKLLKLDSYHKFVLRLWFVKQKELHEEIERFYWKIQPHIRKIKAIIVENSNLIIFTRKDEKDAGPELKKAGSELKKVKLLVKTESEMEAIAEAVEMHVLYDPEKVLSKKTRGG